MFHDDAIQSPGRADSQARQLEAELLAEVDDFESLSPSDERRLLHWSALVLAAEQPDRAG